VPNAVRPRPLKEGAPEERDQRTAEEQFKEQKKKLIQRTSAVKEVVLHYCDLLWL
jgi:hypothetical protein